MLTIGKIYRLEFPGFAARVIEAPPGCAPADCAFLIETLILRSRWYVNERGEPFSIKTPRLIVRNEATQPRRTLTGMLVTWTRLRWL
jgi:hypothetical protein